MELGVPKGKLYMVEYDPAWAEEGRRVVELLRGVMTDAVDIIHGGSTSIPGMFSKPIIDIYIAVNELDDVLQYVDALEALGIHYAGEVVPEHRDFYMDDPVTGYRTHHIHALRYESPKWARYQRIFSYLRAEPRVRDAYTLLEIWTGEARFHG